jgi:hypothetical protein
LAADCPLGVSSNSSDLKSAKHNLTLVHYLHAQSSTVKNICPCVEHTTLTINDGLIEIKAIQIECHRGYTKCGEPDANNGPCSKEEVQGT